MPRLVFVLQAPTGAVLCIKVAFVDCAASGRAVHALDGAPVNVNPTTFRPIECERIVVSFDNIKTSMLVFAPH